MHKEIPVAKVGDVCILVEPAGDESGSLRKLQQSLQTRYGGRLHRRPHFTCQRFSPRDDDHLATIVRALRSQLASLPPLPVTGSELVLACHPFWEFSVLRWDLQLTNLLYDFAGVVESVLAAADLPGHYPLGEEWNPHVTALEEIYQNGFPAGAQAPARHFLYTGRNIVLSQVRPGKQFEIVATIPLTNRRGMAAGQVEYFPGRGHPPIL